MTLGKELWQYHLKPRMCPAPAHMLPSFHNHLLRKPNVYNPTCELFGVVSKTKYVPVDKLELQLLEKASWSQALRCIPVIKSSLVSTVTSRPARGNIGTLSQKRKQQKQAS